MNVIIFILMGLSLAWANPNAMDDLYRRRGELNPPPSIWDVEELNQIFFSELKQHNKELQKIKYYLINGETRLARLYLSQMTYIPSTLKPIIHRYLGILNFIEGRYERSLEFLSKEDVQGIPHYSKICILKVLNQVILGRLDHLEYEWGKCRVENANNFKIENFVWLDTLVSLKLYTRKGVTKVPFQNLRLNALENRDLKIILKLALYLNQDKMLLHKIVELDLTQLQDPEIREIIGHIHFRNGGLANSFKFVEDLKSPNAENIKGNLYILRDKFELAYAQFKVALEQKQNSQNALERLLPLAWLLKDWKNGVVYSERLMATPKTEVNKMTLNAAFLMQKGEFEKSRRVLSSITEISQKGTALDVTQLYSFVSLMQNNRVESIKNGDLSCAQYDIVNCWMIIQMIQWDTFPYLVRRDEKVTHKKEWENLIKEEINDPIKETVYVNQIDIEEMDDKLIQLIPNEIQ